MGRRLIRGAFLIAVLCAAWSAAATPAAAEFGIASFSTSYVVPEGEPLLAGAHPDIVARINFNEGVGPDGSSLMEGQLRDAEFDLPVGFFGSPDAVPACTMAELVGARGICRPAAQVGLLQMEGIEAPIYNMAASAQQVAVLGAVAFGVPARIVLSVRADGDFGLTASLPNLNQGISLARPVLTLWGVPAASIHDPDRFRGVFDKGYPAGIEPRPFLSLPTRCGKPPVTRLRVDSWQEPGIWHQAEDEGPALVGCGELDFAPTLKARPTTDVSDSPSGLEVELKLPQSQDPERRATAQLRDAEIQLPEGLVLNPSGANGLEGCGSPSACPDGSKIGTVEIQPQGFADPLSGSVYLAKPKDNPFGSVLALYLVAAGHGVQVKLAGEMTAEQETGRLSLRFADLPQLPFESLRIALFGGPLAPLRTPLTCRAYATRSALVPWSAPETPSVTATDSYAIDRAPPPGTCARSEADLPQVASLEVGATAPLAGKSRPFVLDLRRQDGTQQLSSVTLTMPPGLSADLTAPTGTQVGEVSITAGAGPKPLPLTGKVLLGGPYKGAPLSLAMVVPALAGPFDLGTVTVRAALDVDPTSAQITVRTDPLPQILEGIPLDLRSLSIQLDRPGFTRNPTSCDPMEIAGTLTSTVGAVIPLRDRFQVGECGRLRFAPQLSLRLLGPTHRSAHPALRVVVSNQTIGANVARAAVTLPRTELLESSHIRGVCSRAEFAAGACPRDSVYGHASAASPLLEAPLRGPVYLRENPRRRLPDLVASLDGRVHIDLVGHLDSRAGRVRATFATPDLPLRRFVLDLAGGRRGLFVNTAGVCGPTDPRVAASLVGHNGKRDEAFPRLRADCPGGTR